MGNYFCGWYFRCQSERQTLAVIPSVHRTADGRFCMVQLITDTQAFSVTIPHAELAKAGDELRIGENLFSPQGIRLCIHTPSLQADGLVRFGSRTPLPYDIMGPFQFVPFLECRHSVLSMRHSVDGAITVNGTPFVFQNGVGYTEGDRGRSFPTRYVWTQCSFPAGALMLSVADIPFGIFRFTGIIGVVLWQGKQYRLATYLGARVEALQDGAVIIRQRQLRLTVRRLDQPGYPLHAPTQGAMARTIHEHPACKVFYRFQCGGRTLFAQEAANAAMEYEYPQSGTKS